MVLFPVMQWSRHDVEVSIGSVKKPPAECDGSGLGAKAKRF
jgi:hypothetical protein